jgi:hypothetical protein
VILSSIILFTEQNLPSLWLVRCNDQLDLFLPSFGNDHDDGWFRRLIRGKNRVGKVKKISKDDDETKVRKELKFGAS